MGDTIKRILSLLLLLATPPVAQAIPLSEEELAGAVFAKDAVYTRAAELRQHTVGMIVRDLTGPGLSYTYPISETQALWAAFNFNPSPILPSPINTKSAFSEELKQSNLFAVMIGGDQTFNPFRRKYWSFVLGAGAGFQTSKYEGRIYRQTCYDPKFCILRDPEEVAATDNFGFLFWRFGVRVSEIRIAGQKAGLVAAFMPVLARWPKNLEITTHNNSFKSRPGERQSSFLVEFNLEI